MWTSSLNNVIDNHYNTTTVSSTAPWLTKTSSESLVSSKESKVALNKKNGVYFATAYDLNIGIAVLKSSSERLMPDDAETKEDTCFTTAYDLNTNTADFKSSLKALRTTDPENICKYTNEHILRF